jgi:hypothetical protein
MQADIAKLGDRSGLTEAERAAFLIFTGGDYGYINPATVVDRGWLKDNEDVAKKKGATGVGAGFINPRGRLDDKTMNEHRMKEGTLHAGMLQNAMQKLPVYEKTVYRGYATTLKEIES